MALHRAISCASFLNRPSVTRSSPLIHQNRAPRRPRRSCLPSTRPSRDSSPALPPVTSITRWPSLIAAAPKMPTKSHALGPPQECQAPQSGTDRANQSWRAVAALGCAPSPGPAGHFYALLGLLTAVERQDRLTSRPASSSRWGNPLPQPTTSPGPGSLNSWHGPGSRPILHFPRQRSRPTALDWRRRRVCGRSGGGARPSRPSGPPPVHARPSPPQQPSRPRKLALTRTTQHFAGPGGHRVCRAGCLCPLAPAPVAVHLLLRGQSGPRRGGDLSLPVRGRNGLCLKCLRQSVTGPGRTFRVSAVQYLWPAGGSSVS